MRALRHQRGLILGLLSLCLLPLLGMNGTVDGGGGGGGGGSAPTLRSYATNADNVSDTDYDCVAPATIEAGDALVCLFTGDESTANYTLSGWTERMECSLAGPTLIVMSKDSVAGTEDGATFTFASDTTNNRKNVCGCFAIANPSGAYEASCGNDGTGEAGAPAAIVSPEAGGSVALRTCIVVGNINTLAYLAGWTAQTQVSTTAGAQREGAIGYDVLSGADSGASMTWNNSGAFSCASLEVE